MIKTYTIKDENIKVDILNLGATIMNIFVKDKFGKEINVVLGFDSEKEYLENRTFFGATIGRCCNRIEDSIFTLNGEKYTIPNNDGKNTLHGGFKGFDTKIWKVESVSNNAITLSYLSEDKEEGYPGNLFAKVKYSVENGELKIEYFAECDSDTIVNLTNHAFFNLGGEDSGDILNTKLWIDADSITKVKKGLIPTGEIALVKGTPFDFTREKEIGKDIDNKDEQIDICGGYDTNYILNGEGLRKVASAISDKTGIRMDVITDDIGMQFYSGNFLDGSIKRGNHSYIKRSAFCLETQKFPNAINIKKFPSVVLKKDKKYSKTTIYRFTIDK